MKKLKESLNKTSYTGTGVPVKTKTPTLCEYVNEIMGLRWYPKIVVEWEILETLMEKQKVKVCRKIKNLDFGEAPYDVFVEYLEDLIFQVKEGLL